MGGGKEEGVWWLAISQSNDAIFTVLNGQLKMGRREGVERTILPSFCALFICFYDSVISPNVLNLSPGCPFLSFTSFSFFW
jgi:hypothetical protein